ncbi:hypothetical protein, partial [Candidatus Sororendozoicomonas aggregata]|uniref:hypothetical protein n=1 Tax=Candidatus Sororendozoicomonas aggregata TaxID=3073239 RepID=UPI002ED12FB2
NSPTIILRNRNFYPQFLAILATGAILGQAPRSLSDLIRDFAKERRTGEYGRLSKTPLEPQGASKARSMFMKYPG